MLSAACKRLINNMSAIYQHPADNITALCQCYVDNMLIYYLHAGHGGDSREVINVRAVRTCVYNKYKDPIIPPRTGQVSKPDGRSLQLPAT